MEFTAWSPSFEIVQQLVQIGPINGTNVLKTNLFGVSCQTSKSHRLSFSIRMEKSIDVFYYYF